MSATRTKRPSLANKAKVTAAHSTDIAASLPHFKPPTTTQQPNQVTTTHSSVLQPASAALSDEATKMQQRLHALRATMEEDKRQREERIKQRKANSTNPHASGTDEQPLSQREYLKQLQARLESKKAATREKVRQVKAAMDKASEYVAPLGHGQRLALFERVSEEWLKDKEDGNQAETEAEKESAEPEGGRTSVEEAKEVFVENDDEDVGAVIVSAGDEEDDNVEAQGHAEFVQAREEWLRSLQPNTAVTTSHTSRPATASSSTTTSAVPTAALVVPVSPSASSVSSSLLAGDQFDESASAASFQEARQAWIQTLTAKPRTTTTPNATSPTLSAQPTPSTVERVSCYQCYRLFTSGAGRVGGESERELCGAECVEALERVERLRRERARSMRAMEQRILALQQEQQHVAAQQQQQQQTTEAEEEDTERDTEPSSRPTTVESMVVPSLVLPVVAAGDVDVNVLDLPVSARRFNATDEQPEPVVEFPVA